MHMLVRSLAFFLLIFHFTKSSSLDLEDHKQIFALECALRNAKQIVVEMCILSDMVPLVDKIEEDWPISLEDYAQRVISHLDIVCLAKVKRHNDGTGSPRLCLDDDQIKDIIDGKVQMANLQIEQVKSIRENLLKNLMIVIPIYEIFEKYYHDKPPQEEKVIRENLETFFRAKLENTIKTF